VPVVDQPGVLYLTCIDVYPHFHGVGSGGQRHAGNVDVAVSTVVGGCIGSAGQTDGVIDSVAC